MEVKAKLMFKSRMPYYETLALVFLVLIANGSIPLVPAVSVVLLGSLCFGLKMYKNYVHIPSLDPYYKSPSFPLDFLDPQVRIIGLSDIHLAIIDKIIQQNRLVVITCRKSILLRKALSMYVENSYGNVRFIDGDTFSIGSDILPTNEVDLEFFSEDKLNYAISAMQKRGWITHGHSAVINKMLVKKFTQKMIYTQSP